MTDKEFCTGHGWLEFHDDLDGTLVVAQEDGDVHFSGDTAWEDCAMWLRSKA